MIGRTRAGVIRFLTVVAFATGLATGAAAQTPAAPRGQYRAFWVDTFNSRFSTPGDVAAIVARAQQAHANVLFVQVRRRGDAWYLDSREPLAEGVVFTADFDPLREILARAHAIGVAVHAVVTVGPIWNQATGPASPAHVFAQHGFTPSGPVPGRQNWLTRARPGDATPATALGGYRFGLDFWLDPGHPDAAAYTVDVITHLVGAYDIDGLLLDALRYPDAIAAPVGTGDPEPSVGYNDVSLERFRRRYALPADALPAPADGAWSDWRRAQVTALLGRITLASLAIRPSLVVSVGVAATGDAPVAATPDGTEAAATAWSASEPFRRAFQDWYRWSEDGLVDALVPLVYRTEHTMAGADAFVAWVRWARAHADGRQLVVAVGAYANAIEGTLRQVRRATAPATAADDPPAADGVVLFSMGAHNAPVAGNPLAVSGPRDTPYRSFDDLASGLLTGRTVSGQALEAGGPAGVFAPQTALPIPAWKLAPTTGHLRGTITVAGRDGALAADGAGVALEWVADDRRGPGGSVPPAPAVPIVAPADGGGVYGRFDLAPGRYRVLVSPIGDGVYRSTCTVTIAPGSVATLDLAVDSARPAVATCVTP